MAEDSENPEDKVRGNTISVRRSKQFMRTVTAPARSPRRTSHRLHSHRLCGGCAASRAPATHCRGRLGPIQYDPRRFRNCGARSPEPLAGAGAGARGGGGGGCDCGCGCGGGGAGAYAGARLGPWASSTRPATSRSRRTRTGPPSGRGSTPTVRLSSFDRHQIDGSSLMGPDKPVTTLERWKDEDLATLPRDGPLQEQGRAERRGPRRRAPRGRRAEDGGSGARGRRRGRGTSSGSSGTLLAVRALPRVAGDALAALVRALHRQ